MKRLLVVVDFQNDFVSGSLGFDGAERLDEKICAKINEYRNSADDIAFTFDTHDDSYLNTQEGKLLPVSHCEIDTWGWQLYGNVAKLEQDRDMRFNKPGFGSNGLYMYLRQNHYDTIEFVGLVTNICVIANAVLAKTALPEARIIVDAACVDSYDKALHKEALHVMEGLQISVTGQS